MAHHDFIDLMRSDFDYGDGESRSDYQKMKDAIAERSQKIYKMF